MTGLAILQTAASVLQKSAEMAEKDPHGAIITIVSVSVVFVSLVILYFAYNFIGKVSSGQWKLPQRNKKAQVRSGVPSAEEAAAITMALDQEMNGETYAAIGMALHRYMNDTIHDIESYIITIKRK